MRLYEEIYEEYVEARCSFSPFSGGYFQGVKNILFLSDTEILLGFKKYSVRIWGERLQIEKYCEGDIRVQGKIMRVECVAEGKEVK